MTKILFPEWKRFFGLRPQNDIDVILSGRTRAGGTHACAPSIDQAVARSEGSCGWKMKGFFGLRPQNDTDVILSKAKDLVGRKKQPVLNDINKTDRERTHNER